ncbi:hypothetical protein [Kitasatospora sp. LaBMicrA B282]|uniref:hypothetical protein n=1 Tax=Kitasatospora sp. LaBMicrA B282 TaxID=3420949 RepID=UPI003D0D8F59
MTDDFPEDPPVDPTSGVDLQQLTAAAAQPAGRPPEPASTAQDGVREERSGAIFTAREPTAADQPSTGPAFRRQPNESDS